MFQRQWCRNKRENSVMEEWCVLACWKQETQKGFAVWTGSEFSDDWAQAKTVNSYSDLIPIIWDGYLWENTEKLKAQGVFKLACFNMQWKRPMLSLNEQSHTAQEDADSQCARQSRIKTLITGKLVLWQDEVFGGSLPRKGNSRFGELITMIAGVCREYKISIQDMGAVLTALARENRHEKSS